MMKAHRITIKDWPFLTGSNNNFNLKGTVYHECDHMMNHKNSTVVVGEISSNAFGLPFRILPSTHSISINISLVVVVERHSLFTSLALANYSNWAAHSVCRVDHVKAHRGGY